MRKTGNWLLVTMVPALMLACSADESVAPGANDLGDSIAAPALPIEPATGTVRDGESPAKAAEATAPANRPPRMLGVEIDAREQARSDRDVSAQPRAEDPENEPIAFEYRWSVNGRLVSEAGDTLPHAHFSRGDRVQLSIRASDGERSSDWWRDDPFPIVNAAPRITSIPGDFDPDGSFRYPIIVDDPDGDRAYRYEVRKAPAGVEIDPVSGTLHWTPRPDQGGIHPVVIAVSDRHGGVAVQEFDVSVGFEDLDPPASPIP